MATPTSLQTGNERISWLEALAGLWPFLIFGPVTVLLAYPYPMPDWRYVLSSRILIACVSLFPLGLGIGWFKRWPRWSYPYPGLALLVLSGFVGNAIKIQRILAMLISLALAIGVRAAGGKFFYGGYGAVLGAIIFIPALLELLPPADPSRAKPPVSIAS